MPTDDFYIICPYYHKTLGNQIFCHCELKNFNEDNAFFKQIFNTRGERNRCIRCYCSSFGYKECSLAKINQSVYTKH